MKILLSFFIFLFSYSSWSQCSFKSEIEKVVSLSGPLTVALRELNLLNDPKLLGISIFNPVSDSNYKKKKYPGGIYLSQSTLNEFENAIVFFDEGRELRRILSTSKKIRTVEIKTRNLLPMEVIESVSQLIISHTVGCEDSVRKFKEKALGMESDILMKIPKAFKAIFYLGAFRNNRPPELVIVNDGMVKKLLKEKKLTTYPSDLSYVSWSTKTMGKLSRDFIHIGVEDSGAQYSKELRRSSHVMTLTHPGSLVPGYSQLEAFLFLVNSL